MKMKKIIVLMLAGCMALGLVACGNGKSGNPGQGKEGEGSNYDWTVGADDSNGKVTINVATWREYDRAYYEEIEKRFEEKYDWIDVKLQINPDSSSYYSNLQADIVSGTAPDVFDTHPDTRLEEYAREGVIAPQTEFDYMENYSERAKNVTTLSGENYGYMNAYNYFGFMYNADIFAKEGIAVPTTPEELVNVVNQLKSAGYGGVAYAGATLGAIKMGQLMLSITLGTDGYAALQKGLDDGSITDISKVEGVPEAMKTLQYYTENDVYYNAYTGMSYESALSLFAQEKTAIVYGGTYSLGEADAYFPGINAQFFPIPTYANNGVTAAEGAQTSVINANSANLGAAKLWIEFLATPEISEYYCTNAKMLSTIQSVELTSETAQMLKNSSKDYAFMPIAVAKNDEYWLGGMQDVFTSVMFNGKSWEEQVRRYANKLEEYDLGNM